MTRWVFEVKRVVEETFEVEIEAELIPSDEAVLRAANDPAKIRVISEKVTQR